MFSFKGQDTKVQHVSLLQLRLRFLNFFPENEEYAVQVFLRQGLQ